MKIIIGLLITIGIFVWGFVMTALCVVYPIVGIPLVLLLAFICLLINIIGTLD